MREKDLLKQVTDLDMPDFEQVRNHINHKKNMHYISPAARRTMYAITCFCLVILFALRLPSFSGRQGNPVQEDVADHNSLPGNIADEIIKDDLDTADLDDDLSCYPADEDLFNSPDSHTQEPFIIFHSFDDISADSAKKHLDEPVDVKELTMDEIVSYFNIDVHGIKLPEGLKSYTETYPDTTYKFIYSLIGTIVDDSVVFSYREDFENPEYDPLKKEMQIFMSKQGYVLDYIILNDDEMDKSIIGGQEFLLGKRKMGYGPYTVVDGPNIPAGYYDLFYAKFVMNGTYFEITSNNFTEEDFIETLASFIEL